MHLRLGEMERVERVERAERVEREERAERAERVEGVERAERAVKSDRLTVQTQAKTTMNLAMTMTMLWTCQLRL
jgi:hypothetical protein